MLLVSQVTDIFVSYASEDRARVRLLVDELTGHGWSVWWDRELVAGPRFEDAIQAAIDAARCVIVVWSDHSVNSRWCRDEASEGLERDILVPLTFDDVRPPLSFRSAHTANLQRWPAAPGELDSVLAGVRRCLNEAVGAAAERTADAQPARRRTGLVVVGAVLVLLAVGSFLLWPGVEFQRETAAAANQAGASGAVTLAILPFVDRSPERAQQYFADGIAEEIITALSRSRGMRVLARGTTFRFRGDAVDRSALADEFGVTHVLEGSSRSGGQRVRITAQLVEVASGLPVWTESYDRELRDVLAVQDDVARSVAGALQATLGDARTPAAVNENAYDAYLKGLDARRTNDFPIAAQWWDRALAADPDFVPAHEALLLLFYEWQLYGQVVPDAMARVQRHLDAIVRLAPDNPVTQRVRARLEAHYSRDWAGYASILQAQARAYPNDTTVWFQLAIQYERHGRPADADAVHEYLEYLDPDLRNRGWWRARMDYYFLGRPQAGKRRWLRMVANQPVATYDLCIVSIIEPDPGLADFCATSIAVSTWAHEQTRLTYAYLRAVYGGEGAARGALFAKIAGAPDLTRGFKAFMAAYGGDLDTAFEQLEEAVDAFDLSVYGIVNGRPFLADNRGQRTAFIADPRHAALLHRIGFDRIKLPPAERVLAAAGVPGRFR